MSLTALDISRLGTVHADLRRLFIAVSQEAAISILCGHRTQQEQNTAFHTGHSRLQWPYSRHNSFPSEAVDVAANPIDWTNLHQFQELADLVKAKALALGIPVEWGGDWPHFADLAHWQLPAK